jgi:hypothetical protein
MITKIEPERGGEAQRILRVELSLPMSRHELLRLRHWLAHAGFAPDVDDIDEYFRVEGRADVG